MPDLALDSGHLRDDFLAFCDHFAIPLWSWQREAFGEALRREGDKFRYRLVGISVPRGNGKSFTAAQAGRWALIRRPKAHVLTAALTSDGARVVFGYGQEAFRGLTRVVVRANAIEIPSIKSRWTITSREHTSSRGLHPDFIVYDEVGWAHDDELFSSLLAAQASVEDPLMLVISTVGRRKSGPLWRIRELAEANAPGVFWWYSSENLSPRVTQDFLERQRRILLPGQFAREHQNQWVEGADAFTSAAAVDWAMGQGWTERVQGDQGCVYEVFVDLGAVHDPTVIGVAHEEAGVVFVDRLVTFQGSREAPVQLAAVEEMIQDLCSAFPVYRIRIESWQGLSAVQSLGRLGLPVELFTPTAKAHREEWPVLAQRLATRTLVLPAHAALREELLNLLYEVGPAGVRVVDRGAVHQDHAVVVRGLVASLSQSQPAPVASEPTPEELASLRRALPGWRIMSDHSGGIYGEAEPVVFDEDLKMYMDDPEYPRS